MTDVTIVGLGQMGTRLSELLLDAGHSVTVWNRSADKADRLRARGAVVAERVSDAFSESPISVVILSDYFAVQPLLANAEVLRSLSDKIVINLGTNSADDAIDAEAIVVAAGGRYLDGAIQAAPSQMGQDDTPILISGDHSAFVDATAILRAFGGGIEHLGRPIDAAAYMDLATLSYVYGAFAGFLHGARIAEARSIDVGAFGRIVQNIAPSFGAFFAHEARVIASGDFAISESPLRISTVAVRRIAGTSTTLGINSELPTLVQSWLDQASKEGFDDQELAAVIKVLRARR